MIRGVFLAREKSRWTARPYRRFAPRIHLSRCLRHSAVRISNCASRTTTIFSLITRTDETRRQADLGEPPAGTFRLDIPVYARAPSDFSMSKDKPALPLVAIVGPTASGKSALAV